MPCDVLTVHGGELVREDVGQFSTDKSYQISITYSNIFSTNKNKNKQNSPY